MPARERCQHRREMQARGRRGDRALLAREHRLIVGAILVVVARREAM